MTYHTSLPKPTSSSVKKTSSSGVNLMDSSYNTVSCPCSSYAVDLNNGQTGCERDYLGVITSVKPVYLKNHIISGHYPKVGDKWLCANLKCEDGDFKWDTLHVVNVEKSSEKSSSSLFNSKKSTLKCNTPSVPNSNPKGYINTLLEGVNIEGNVLTARIDNSTHTITEPISHVDGVPLFEDSLSAHWHSIINAKSDSDIAVTPYEKDSLRGFLPIFYQSTNKVITSIIVNGKKITDELSRAFSTINDNEHEYSRMTFKNNGDFFNIKIKGRNNPMVTVSLKDSSGCDILKEKQVNVVIGKEYNVTQEIPILPYGKISETYNLKISPSADTKFNYGADEVNNISGIINMKIYQYKDPTFTFEANTSTISGVNTHSTDITFGGAVDGYMSIDQEGSYVEKTHTTTLANTASILFCKNPMPKFKDLFSKSNIIKKSIFRENTNDTSGVYIIKIAKKIELNANDIPVYQGDIKVGMIFKSNLTKTKTIRKSIDVETRKEPCDDCPEIDILTNKFEVDHTRDIFVGMKVEGVDASGRKFMTTLMSVDGSNCITLGNSYVVNKNADITLKYIVGGAVDKVEESKETQIIHLDTSVQSPHGTEITFENGNLSNINGRCLCKNSKTDQSIEITTIIDYVKYGQEDVTFTLDVDKIVTITPNSRDQHIVVGKNTESESLNFKKGIFESKNAELASITITKGPSNGKFGGNEVLNTAAYIPAHGFVGKDTIKFTIATPITTETAKLGYTATFSSVERTFFITVK